MPPYERVGQVYVVPEWTIENAMLTPTMKLKRNRIADFYEKEIAQNLGGVPNRNVASVAIYGLQNLER